MEEQCTESMRDLKEYEFEIVSLKETIQKEIRTKVIGNYLHICSGIPKENHARVSILLHKNL